MFQKMTGTLAALSLATLGACHSRQWAFDPSDVVAGDLPMPLDHLCVELGVKGGGCELPFTVEQVVLYGGEATPAQRERWRQVTRALLPALRRCGVEATAPLGVSALSWANDPRSKVLVVPVADEASARSAALSPCLQAAIDGRPGTVDVYGFLILQPQAR